MKTLFRSSLLAIVLGVNAAAALATPAKLLVKLPVVHETETQVMERVEAYLSSISTIVSDFNQVAPDGSLAAGKFYLKRPGKMRWQYAPPTPILLVSDGSRIVYYDSELNQVTYIGMDDTLAGFLAQKSIKLEGPTTHVTKVESQNGMIRVTLVQKSKPKEGNLTLEFSDKPLQLRQMAIVDATGQTTHVQLQNAVFGGPVEDKLFVFEDPRGVRYIRSIRK